MIPLDRFYSEIVILSNKLLNLSISWNRTTVKELTRPDFSFFSRSGCTLEILNLLGNLLLNSEMILRITYYYSLSTLLLVVFY